ncbi:MAG: DUF1778 domain-containing protein [Planctomycetota bacterium]|nr:DUF1778 domain-containing protein [Planctomycetota bacterium]
MAKNGKLREVFRKPRRVAWFDMRLTPEDKASIRQAAQTVGKSMTDYLLGLHRFAIGNSKRDA